MSTISWKDGKNEKKKDYQGNGKLSTSILVALHVVSTLAHLNALPHILIHVFIYFLSIVSCCIC